MQWFLQEANRPFITDVPKNEIDKDKSIKIQTLH